MSLVRHPRAPRPLLVNFHQRPCFDRVPQLFAHKTNAVETRQVQLGLAAPDVRGRSRTTPASRTPRSAPRRGILHRRPQLEQPDVRRGRREMARTCTARSQFGHDAPRTSSRSVALTIIEDRILVAGPAPGHTPRIEARRARANERCPSSRIPWDTFSPSPVVIRNSASRMNGLHLLRPPWPIVVFDRPCPVASLNSDRKRSDLLRSAGRKYPECNCQAIQRQHEEPESPRAR